MLDVRWAPEDVDHVMEQAVKGASVWHPDALDLNSGNAFPEAWIGLVNACAAGWVLMTLGTPMRTTARIGVRAAAQAVT